MDPKQIPSASRLSTRDQHRIDLQAADRFAKMQGGSVTANEIRQLRTWLDADPARRKAYQETESFWQDPVLTQALTDIPLSNPSRDSRKHCNRNRIFISALAASFLLVAVILQTKSHCFNADYCTGAGEIRSIQLADGSVVMLATDSAVNVSLQSQLRQVQLVQGEAFFDVRRNPEQPFVVDGRNSQTRVLGTKFIVREDQDSDTVTVIHGVVSVRQPHDKPAILKVNDQITVGSEHSSNITQVSGANVSAWTKGHLLFENVSLGAVATEIGRYRKGALVVKNKRLKALKVSGRFSIDDTDKALEALEQTLPIRVYRLTPWLVVIA